MSLFQTKSTGPGAFSFLLALAFSFTSAQAKEPVLKSVNKPEAAAIKNRVYRVPGFKDSLFYPLKNWSFREGGDTVALDHFAFGDLNGDGFQDACAILSYNGGGSGTMTGLYVLINNGGKGFLQSYDEHSFYNCKLKSMTLKKAVIQLNYLSQKDDDPNLEPATVNKTATIKLTLPPISKFKPQPQKHANLFKSILPYMNKLILESWQEEKKPWKEFKNMSDKQFSESFNYYHGPGKAQRPKPVWKELPSGGKPCVVDFIVNEGGAVVDLNLIASSGMPIFDHVAMASVNATDLNSVISPISSATESIGHLELHMRATFDKSVHCQIQPMTMPTLGNVFLESQ